MRRTIVAAVVALFAAPVGAQTATYTFTGLATGQYGTTAFTDAALTLTLTQDVAIAPQRGTAGGLDISNYGGTGCTQAIAGVFAAAPCDAPGLVDVNRTWGLLGIGTSGVNLFLLDAAPFRTYDLRSTLAPVSVITIFPGQGLTSANGQSLQYYWVSNAHFQVTVTATTTPEPTTVALVGAGLLAFGVAVRRRGVC